MIIYKYKHGYGNVDIKEIQEVISHLPDSKSRELLRELLYDYECLKRVIHDTRYIFEHEDGSQVRRIKLFV